MIFSVPALLALSGVAILALFPDGRLLAPDASLPDRATLLFLAICAIGAQIPVVWNRIQNSQNGATWAFTSAFFVLFHLADRAGPREGFALPFSLAPDDGFVISYATRIAILGALLSLPLWAKKGGPQRFVVAGLGLVGALGFGTFWFLSQFYEVGATETLDPTPLATLVLQMLGYGALALCCRAVATQNQTRNWMWRILPVILLAVWARHQFSPIAAPVEEDE